MSQEVLVKTPQRPSGLKEYASLPPPFSISIELTPPSYGLQTAFSSPDYIGCVTVDHGEGSIVIPDVPITLFPLQEVRIVPQFSLLDPDIPLEPMYEQNPLHHGQLERSGINWEHYGTAVRGLHVFADNGWISDSNFPRFMNVINGEYGIAPHPVTEGDPIAQTKQATLPIATTGQQEENQQWWNGEFVYPDGSIKAEPPKQPSWLGGIKGSLKVGILLAACTGVNESPQPPSPQIPPPGVTQQVPQLAPELSCADVLEETPAGEALLEHLTSEDVDMRCNHLTSPAEHEDFQREGPYPIMNDLMELAADGLRQKPDGVDFQTFTMSYDPETNRFSEYYTATDGTAYVPTGEGLKKGVLDAEGMIIAVEAGDGQSLGDASEMPVSVNPGALSCEAQYPDLAKAFRTNFFNPNDEAIRNSMIAQRLTSDRIAAVDIQNVCWISNSDGNAPPDARWGSVVFVDPTHKAFWVTQDSETGEFFDRPDAQPQNRPWQWVNIAMPDGTMGVPYYPPGEEFHTILAVPEGESSKEVDVRAYRYGVTGTWIDPRTGTEYTNTLASETPVPEATTEPPTESTADGDSAFAASCLDSEAQQLVIEKFLSEKGYLSIETALNDFADKHPEEVATIGYGGLGSGGIDEWFMDFTGLVVGGYRIPLGVDDGFAQCMLLAHPNYGLIPLVVGVKFPGEAWSAVTLFGSESGKADTITSPEQLDNMIDSLSGKAAVPHIILRYRNSGDLENGSPWLNFFPAARRLVSMEDGYIVRFTTNPSLLGRRVSSSVLEGEQADPVSVIRSLNPSVDLGLFVMDVVYY